MPSDILGMLIAMIALLVVLDNRRRISLIEGHLIGKETRELREATRVDREALAALTPRLHIPRQRGRPEKEEEGRGWRSGKQASP